MWVKLKSLQKFHTFYLNTDLKSLAEQKGGAWGALMNRRVILFASADVLKRRAVITGYLQ
jgi:hypothetical protein